MQVVVDYAKGNLQDIKLIALRLKKAPRLSEIYDQSSSGTLGLLLLGSCGLQLSLEGADPLLCLVTLSDGPVALPAGRATLRAEPLRNMAQLVSLRAQPGDRLGI